MFKTIFASLIAAAALTACSHNDAARPTNPSMGSPHHTASGETQQTSQAGTVGEESFNSGSTNYSDQGQGQGPDGQAQPANPSNNVPSGTAPGSSTPPYPNPMPTDQSGTDTTPLPNPNPNPNTGAGGTSGGTGGTGGTSGQSGTGTTTTTGGGQ